MPRPSHPDLDPSAHGLTIWDLDRTFHAESFGVLPLRTLLDRLRQTYAGKIGVQYMHIDNRGRAEVAAAAHGAGRGPVLAGCGYAAAHPEETSS